jgi:hypothetical protein
MMMLFNLARRLEIQNSAMPCQSACTLNLVAFRFAFGDLKLIWQATDPPKGL